MINGGYILQPRIFGESDASKMPPVTRELWFYLLRRVNHKDNGKYKRGHGFFCLNDIQQDLSWHVGYRKEVYSKPQLTKSLRRLRDDNMIATTKATRGVYVTICNYGYYQDPKNYEGNDEGSTKETRRKSSGHTKNKNVKNEKNEKKDQNIYPEWLNEDLLKQFKSMRVKIKKPMTDKAVNLLISKLEKFKDEGQNIDEIIEQSILNSWAGVFEVKSDKNKPRKTGLRFNTGEEICRT